MSTKSFLNMLPAHVECQLALELWFLSWGLPHAGASQHVTLKNVFPKVRSKCCSFDQTWPVLYVCRWQSGDSGYMCLTNGKHIGNVTFHNSGSEHTVPTAAKLLQWPRKHIKIAKPSTKEYELPGHIFETELLPRQRHLETDPDTDTVCICDISHVLACLVEWFSRLFVLEILTLIYKSAASYIYQKTFCFKEMLMYIWQGTS